jgi:tetratricopeptide (TPR) repeat protein
MDVDVQQINSFIVSGKKESLEEAFKKLQPPADNKEERLALLFKLGKGYFTLENFDQSVEIFTIVSKSNNLVSPEAKKIIGDDLESSNTEAWSHLYLGIAYYKKNDYIKAKSNLTQATKIKEDEPSFFIALGQFYYKLDILDNAEKNYLDALAKAEISFVGKEEEKKEFNAYANLYLGMVLQKKNKCEEAKRKFLNALEYFENEIKKKDDIENKIKKKKPSEEVQKKRDVTEKTPLELMRALVLTNIAQVELDEEDYGNSKDHLETASKIYLGYKDYFETLPTGKKSIEIENASSLFNNYGIWYYKQDDYDSAKKEFNKALEFKHNSARVYNNLANVYAKKGDFKGAEWRYREALRINPDLKTARNNIKLLKSKQPISWWEWWFGKPMVKISNTTSCNDLGITLRWRNLLGVGLIVILLLLITSVFLPFFGMDYPIESNTTVSTKYVAPISSKPSLDNFNRTMKMEMKYDKNASSNNFELNNASIVTTYESPINSKTTTETRKAVSPETRLLFAALVLFILIHPQVKGFSAGTIKLDMEPIAITKDAGGLEFMVEH